MLYSKIKKYKYKLEDTEFYNFSTDETKEFLKYHYEINKRYFELTSSMITIKKGYSWDGASGPTIDTKNSMRASLVHDVMYQCFREGLMDIRLRKMADKILKKILIQDGMSKIRANIWYLAVRSFGVKSSKPSNFYLVAP